MLLFDEVVDDELLESVTQTLELDVDDDEVERDLLKMQLLAYDEISIFIFDAVDFDEQIAKVEKIDEILYFDARLHIDDEVEADFALRDATVEVDDEVEQDYETDEIDVDELESDFELIDEKRVTVDDDDDEVEVVDNDEVEVDVVDELVEVENVFFTILVVIQVVAFMLVDDEVEVDVVLMLDELDVDDYEVLDEVQELDVQRIVIEVDDDEVEVDTATQPEFRKTDDIDEIELFSLCIAILVDTIFNDEIVFSVVVDIKFTDSHQTENFVFDKEDRLFCAVFLLKILNYDVFEYIQKCFIL